MREIKFRAWDVKAQRYQTFDGFERWGMIQSTKDNTWSATGSDMLLLTDNPEFFIWEQYTGLRDKNGVEIYEGDLVRMTTKVTLDTIRTGTVFEDEVAFHNGRFYVKGEASYFAIGDRFESDIEVIGNIHENPELLA